MRKDTQEIRNAMKPRDHRPRSRINLFHGVIAIFSVAALSLDQSFVLAQQAQSQVMTKTGPAPEEAPTIPNAQLDSLVAPIALYPDPLLGQTLAASTYPLELIQLQQWMERNKNLKDKALADAVEKQNWDPSVQAMAAFPDVLQRMAGNIQWTTDLGNAFLAQQSDVMDAIQRMRAKAQGTGNLKTSAQQVVESKTVEGGKQAIVVEQADPQVVYVPSYDPVVVYGEPAYPYYPYYYPGYIGGAGLWFGAGLILGAAWGGGWGWGCGWGRGDININYNNKYINHYNKQNNINRGQGGGKWQHHPEHRGNAPYGDRRTAEKFGGRTQGDRNRPRSGAGNRPGGGTGARPGGGASTKPAARPSRGGAGNRSGGGAGNRSRATAGARPGGGASKRPAARPSGGGPNRVGNRSVSTGSGFGSNSNAFGGRGLSGSSARSSSYRGGGSMGGGGFSRGGGRGGGGRRR